MLHLHDIESGYGAGQVLFGISLSVPAGHVVSLMGRNGMGKTTTIRTIMGQLPLTAGRISRFGNDQPDQLPFRPISETTRPAGTDSETPNNTCPAP